MIASPDNTTGFSNILEVRSNKVTFQWLPWELNRGSLPKMREQRVQIGDLTQKARRLAILTGPVIEDPGSRPP
jgi:hypothetical protein